MNMTPPSFGFITIAWGARRYFRQAEALAASLRLHMPGYPVALICDRPVANTSLFDHTILLDSSIGLGTLQKAWLDQYSPFDETFFIDSDSLVTRPFHTELAEIRHYEFSPIVPKYLTKDDQDTFYLNDLPSALERVQGEKFPKFNGGVYFFKKGEKATRILSMARALSKRGTELGMKSFDKGGPADETIIGLSLAHYREDSLYDDKGRLMRTPININGPLQIDVLGGGCSFIKEGVPVRPAICHFAAPYAQYWPYHYNCFLANYPKSSALTRAVAKFIIRVQRKIINKYKDYNRFK